MTIPTLPQMIIGAAHWFGFTISEDRAVHVVTESLRSVWITAGPLLAGFALDCWQHAGPGYKDPSTGDWITTQARNLHDVFAYAFHSGHLLDYVVAQVLAPALRGTIAAATPLNGRRASDPSPSSAPAKPTP